MTRWVYAWQSPDAKHWSSHYQFESYEKAVDSAIWHAMTRHPNNKNRWRGMVDKKQRKLVWRSMRKAGWRVRRKLDKP